VKLGYGESKNCFDDLLGLIEVVHGFANPFEHDFGFIDLVLQLQKLFMIFLDLQSCP
jgi:hypothetical protein